MWGSKLQLYAGNSLAEEESRCADRDSHEPSTGMGAPRQAAAVLEVGPRRGAVPAGVQHPGASPLGQLGTWPRNLKKPSTREKLGKFMEEIVWCSLQ